MACARRACRSEARGALTITPVAGSAAHGQRGGEYRWDFESRLPRSRSWSVQQSPSSWSAAFRRLRNRCAGRWRARCRAPCRSLARQPKGLPRRSPRSPAAISSSSSTSRARWYRRSRCSMPSPKGRSKPPGRRPASGRARFVRRHCSPRCRSDRLRASTRPGSITAAARSCGARSWPRTASTRCSARSRRQRRPAGSARRSPRSRTSKASRCGSWDWVR